MFKNYLKIALRNLLRHKGYSFINIAGLAIGMACFLLILFYVQFEKSYDNFHVNGSRIYRVLRESVAEGYVDRRANTGAPLAPLLLQDFPAITNAVRFTNFYEGLVGANDKYFNETRFFFADPSVFDVLTFPLRRGDPKTALKEPFSVVITPEIAEKYFGDADPLNQTLSYQTRYQKEKADFKVTGILEEIPANSHLKFDFLASYPSLRSLFGAEFMDRNWESPTWVYVQLQAGYSVQELEKQFPAFVEKYVDKQQFTSVKFRLQPLKDIYFHSLGMGGPVGDFGIPFISYILLIIAGLVLLIASINFMNLATARSGTRAREIGVRKVLGANRFRLMQQFLGESLFYSFLALILAIVLVELVLPTFKTLVRDAFPTFGIFARRQIDIHYAQNIGGIFFTALMVGIISGIYPAFFLSAFQPAQVIKGEARSGRSSAWFRKLLVVSQFAASTVLIISSLVIFRQIHYMKHKDLGFNKDYVLTIPIHDRSLRDRYELFKNQLLQNPNILGVTASSQVPGVGSQNIVLLKSQTHEDVELGIIRVDPDYVKTLGIKLVSGRDFSKAITSDAEHAILMNETAVQKLGWQEANGQEIELYFKSEGKIVPVCQASLVGVLKDFNFREVRMPVQPLILKIDPLRYSHIFVRINSKNMSAIIDYVKKSWQDFHFNQSFEFSFLADELNKVYAMYDTLAALVSYGAFLAIFIAGVGLFGLAFFIAERKTKEIGIRKAFGASVAQIVMMLSKSFLKWVLVANILAWPIAYYLVSQFLRNFHYRINIGVGVFLITALMTLVFALTTVSYQAIKAALANPVEALRYE